MIDIDFVKRKYKNFINDIALDESDYFRERTFYEHEFIVSPKDNSCIIIHSIFEQRMCTYLCKCAFVTTQNGVYQIVELPDWFFWFHNRKLWINEHIFYLFSAAGVKENKQILELNYFDINDIKTSTFIEGKDYKLESEYIRHSDHTVKRRSFDYEDIFYKMKNNHIWKKVDADFQIIS